MENQIKEKKKGSKKDAINLDNLKYDLSKGKKDLLNKESSNASKSIYKGMNELSSDDKKKFRSKIRRGLKGYINDILGKDRSDEERKNAIESFMKFYEENWIIQDFKIENFSNARNEIDLQNAKDLLSYLKSIMQ